MAIQFIHLLITVDQSNYLLGDRTYIFPEEQPYGAKQQPSSTKYRCSEANEWELDVSGAYIDIV